MAIKVQIAAVVPLKPSILATVPVVPAAMFPATLGIILLFDLLWFATCHNYDSGKRIQLWAYGNLFNVILSALIDICISAAGRPAVGEVLCYIAVLLLSVADIADFVSKKQVFARWLKRVLAPLVGNVEFPS